jgi:predicted  nucleic acid-binding Zn-ribbon protein
MYPAKEFNGGWILGADLSKQAPAPGHRPVAKDPEEEHEQMRHDLRALKDRAEDAARCERNAFDRAEAARGRIADKQRLVDRFPRGEETSRVLLVRINDLKAEIAELDRDLADLVKTHQGKVKANGEAQKRLKAFGHERLAELKAIVEDIGAAAHGGEKRARWHGRAPQ